MSVSISGLVLAAPDVATQLWLAAMWALTWYVCIELSSVHIFKPSLRRQSWKERWVGHFRRYMLSNFSVAFNSDEQFLDFGSAFLAVILQHGLGGAMCLPSVLGCRGSIAGALARHGALCEAGWELQDLAQRFWQVSVGGEEGRARNPPMLLLFTCIHHVLGLSMVIPMNLAYGSHRLYHEMVFQLQGAAFIALASQSYGWTLDTDTASGLRRLRRSSGLVLVVYLWSRLLRYWPLALSCLHELYVDGNFKMVSCAAPALCLMGFLNLVLVRDAAKKFIKFVTMPLPKERWQRTKLNVIMLGQEQLRPSTIHLECGNKSRWLPVQSLRPLWPARQGEA